MALIGPVMSGTEGGQTRLAASSTPGGSGPHARRRQEQKEQDKDNGQDNEHQRQHPKLGQQGPETRRRRTDGDLQQRQLLQRCSDRGTFEARSCAFDSATKVPVTEAAMEARMAELRAAYQRLHRRGLEEEAAQDNASRCSSGTGAVSVADDIGVTTIPFALNYDINAFALRLQFPSLNM